MSDLVNFINSDLLDLMHNTNIIYQIRLDVPGFYDCEFVVR